jgi:hypothetical protein
MRVNLFSDRGRDSQSATLAPTGSFEIKGLRRGVYEIAPSVKGYEPRDSQSLEVLIDRDVDDFEAVLQPEAPTETLRSKITVSPLGLRGLP